MKVFLLGAGASKSYNQSFTNEKMPIARDFFKVFNELEISQNLWVKIGDILNYLRDNYNIDPNDFIDFNEDIEVIHSEIDTKLQESISDGNQSEISSLFRIYMELVFLFTSVINEIQNGPVSKAHINIANELNPEDYVITFNWDTLIDRALSTNTSWTTDKGYLIEPRMIYKDGWIKPNETINSILAPKLLKLHGSTNWLTSHMIIEEESFTLTQELPPDTFYVYENTVSPYNTYDGRFMEGYEPFSYGYYPVNLPDKRKKEPDGYILYSTKPKYPFKKKGGAGNAGLVSMPLIVPPVKNKSYNMFGKLFDQLWKTAEEALILAELIVIIGYSFPATDVQSKKVFKDAFMKRNTIPRITILDPYPERLSQIFEFELGIPRTHLKVINEYFSEGFDMNRLR